ncbi:CAAX amino terminal protease family [Rubrivivax sp. A210]|uniref:CPBP family intramembrane glutamic endopeptidase n=1 Tax=Rubrivivax sp. A210 TaxID=2772301 RepID=UPI00191B3BD4|nr:CPBP family intramembrane glutamic endopeptidase [Rubrivivax sp. A210]CAD5367143.1 CAAX amino terminal protease family [Rubrivivax sp. A210]
MQQAPIRPQRGLCAPSVAAGVAVWLAYTAVTVTIQFSAGIPYTEWFKTAANAWRTGVMSLAAGSILLIAVVAATRWSHLWHDPVRLPTTPLMKLAMALCVGATGLRLAGVRWADVPLDLLAAIVVSGVLVGFAEETLFRGLFLRALREGGRSEAVAAIWTAVCFGLFHLPNLAMGTGLVGTLQVILAATSGVVLYLFRRQTGALWPAMLMHGTWDIAAFLAGTHAQPWLSVPSLALQAVLLLLGLALLVGLYRSDRATVALPAGTGQA